MKTPHWVGLGLALAVTTTLIVAYEYSRAPEATRIKAGDLAPDLELPSVGGESTLTISR